MENSVEKCVEFFLFFSHIFWHVCVQHKIEWIWNFHIFARIFHFIIREFLFSKRITLTPP